MQEEITAEVQEDVQEETTSDEQEEVQEETTPEVQSEVAEGITVTVSTETVLVADLPQKCDGIPEDLTPTEGQEPVQEQSIPFDQCCSPEKASNFMAATQCSVEEILIDT